jgi:hypothetical protein
MGSPRFFRMRPSAQHNPDADKPLKRRATLRSHRDFVEAASFIDCSATVRHAWDIRKPRRTRTVQQRKYCFKVIETD